MKPSGFNRTTGSPTKAWPSFLSILLFVFAGVASALVLRAAAPLAGTVIGNAASATYKDNANIDRQVTSNVVTTVVLPVYSHTLAADRTAVVAHGGQVTFPHTLQNTGNASDSYTIELADHADGLTNVNSRVFADLNKDGIPDDPAAPLNLATFSVSLAPGQEFGYVIVGSNITANGSLTTHAHSVQSGTQSNTDSVTLTNEAVINLTKSVDRSSGPADGVQVNPTTVTGTRLTYTLTYTNTGNSAARNLRVTDLLDPRFIYVPGSAKWSVPGTLTDATGGDTPNGQIVYDYNIATLRTLTAVIDTVQPGETRTLTFEVVVAAGTAPGVVPNTARFAYFPVAADPGVNPYPTGANNGSEKPSNTVPYTVEQLAGVWFGVNLDTNDEDAPTGTGLIGTITAANPGTTVTFVNRVYNKGNGTDSFDITYPLVGATGNTFPTGTTFFLYKSDGNTPLIDTTGDGVPDTGPVAPAAFYDVVIKAILPTTAPATTTPAKITVTATSQADPTKFNTTVDTLSAVSALRVDLKDATVNGGTITGSNGANHPGGIATPTTPIVPADHIYADAGYAKATVTRTNTVNPGSTTVFTLTVTNPNLGLPDTYNISYGATASTVGGLPAGWTVAIKDSAGGPVLTNTGVVSGQTSRNFIVEVTPPATAAPGLTDIYIRIVSPTTGAEDIIHNGVQVNTVRKLTLEPNNSGQTYPGGIVVYDHTLTNHGNVIEGNGATVGAPINSHVALTRADNTTAWNSVIYYDADNNGQIDSADPVVTDLSFVSASAAGLAPGESVRLLVKVFAPVGAANLASNVTTLATTTTDGTNSVATLVDVSATDTTTVVLGDLTIEKEQSADGTTWVKSQISRQPGQKIYYRLTVKNTGSAPSTEVFVYDTVPAFTTAVTAGSATDGVATVVSGGTLSVVVKDGSAGEYEFSLGSLSPGITGEITFAVVINAGTIIP